jgi:hypothetical protein
MQSCLRANFTVGTQQKPVQFQFARLYFAFLANAERSTRLASSLLEANAGRADSGT